MARETRGEALAAYGEMEIEEQAVKQQLGEIFVTKCSMTLQSDILDTLFECSATCYAYIYVYIYIYNIYIYICIYIYNVYIYIYIYTYTQASYGDV